MDLNIENHNDSRIIAYNFVETRSTVLDVGCACGDFGEIISKEKHCDVTGIEYDQGSIIIARDTNAFSNLHLVDLNQFDETEFKQYYGFFDYITLLDVLEHLINPDLVLLKLRKFLKKDGFMVISLPNISFGEIKMNILKDDFTYTDLGILDRTHLKFFTYKTIINFLTNLNFEICEDKVKVCDFKVNKVPFFVKKYIQKNPHSYAFQYIVKVCLSDLGFEELLKINSNRMQLEWTTINKELKLIRKGKWMNMLLPIKSRRRIIVKKIYRWIVKSRF
jgi:2-polyprenyl-3-methyl-5-hydroxy-6-metoxy-1,4-benzoquinol methylase